MKTILRLCVYIAIYLIAAHSALAHWPNQPPHQIAELGEFKLEGGGVIKNLKMSYVTHGKLNAAKDNAILFIHAFSTTHHLFDYMIGPGKPLDTNKYFIICPDALGATQSNYVHSTSPTNSGLKMKFPQYNGRDMNNAQYKLITEKLGVSHLLMVTGISSGADHSVQFAVTHPDFMDSIVPLVGGALWDTQGLFRVPAMFSAIESCEGWKSGDYDDNPQICATNALSLLIPYLYTREWWAQYVDTPEAYDRWRKNFGALSLDVQDTRDLYYRMRAWTTGWVGDTPGFNGDLEAALRAIKAKALFIYSPQDQIHSVQHIETQVSWIRGARAVGIESPAGHMICCGGDPNATHKIAELFRSFLDEVTAQRSAKR